MLGQSSARQVKRVRSTVLFITLLLLTTQDAVNLLLPTKFINIGVRSGIIVKEPVYVD